MSEPLCDPHTVRLLAHLTEITALTKFALPALEKRSNMKLDDLATALHEAAFRLRNAYQAAYLYHVGADLADSWTDGPSRPQAVLARHEHCGGHVEVPRLVSDLQSPHPEHIPMPPYPGDGPRAADRPRCGSAATTTGKPCRNAVAIIEGGLPASACHHHMDWKEGASHNRHWHQIGEWLRERERREAEARLRAAEKVMVYLEAALGHQIDPVPEPA